MLAPLKITLILIFLSVNSTFLFRANGQTPIAPDPVGEVGEENEGPDLENCTRAESVSCSNRPAFPKCNMTARAAYHCGNTDPEIDENGNWWVCPILCYNNCPTGLKQTNDIDAKDELKVIETPLLPSGPSGMQNVSYVINGPQEKVCYEVVPCRLNAEVSTYEDPDAFFDCFASDENGNYADHQPANPKFIQGKRAWCIPATDPPSDLIDQTRLEWNKATFNENCNKVYGPGGSFWIDEENEVP